MISDLTNGDDFLKDGRLGFFSDPFQKSKTTSSTSFNNQLAEA